MEFLIRLVHVHEAFRKPELEALAVLHNLDLEIIEYSETSPFCIVRLPSITAAQKVISRSILALSIHELYASSTDYPSLHSLVKQNTTAKWHLYDTCSFRFTIDSFKHTHDSSAQKAIVESFSYLPFNGPIRLSKPDVEFTVCEDYDMFTTSPKRIFFGRLVAKSARDVVQTYTLKKRKYISTTSMDSELALIGANLALAAPGKIFYDPFVGTGSLPIAASHFGAVALGSDMDGRMVRGKNGKSVKTSFQQYGLGKRWIDGFVSDLTFSPLRKIKGGWLDGIVCDPPYGVREGLKVLGHGDDRPKEVVYIDGKPAHLAPDYVPPRRAYSFEAMLGDILDFAAEMLVENGRVSMWMPTANDEEQELEIPQHGALELVSECIQPFNKWSRRLLTYRRRADAEVLSMPSSTVKLNEGKTADDLNNFRKRFFQGFRTDTELTPDTEAANNSLS